MHVFKEISVVGDWSQLETFMNQLPLCNDWERNRESEERVHAGGIRSIPVFAFSASTTGTRPACTAWFHANDSRTEVVLTNIVPRESGQLSKQQYNAIVDEFYSTIIQPFAQTQGLEAKLSSDQKTLEDFFSSQTVRKLRSFSINANMSTGSGHPLDQKRWIDFIISAHQERTETTGGDLVEILVEDLGWPEDIASSLASQYDFARYVLRQSSGEQ